MRTIKTLSYIILIMFVGCTKDRLEPNLIGTWKAESSERTFIYEFGEKEMKVYTTDCKLISEGSYYTLSGTLYRTPHTPLDYYEGGKFKKESNSLKFTNYPSMEEFNFERTDGICQTR